MKLIKLAEGSFDKFHIIEKLIALNSKKPHCTDRVEANTCLLEFSYILENVVSPLFKGERCFDEKKIESLV